MHIPGVEKLVAKLFGGVKPHHRLSPEDLALTEPIVKEAGKGAWVWPLVAWIVIVLAGVMTSIIHKRLTGAAVNPILDDRAFQSWTSIFLFALCGAFFAGLTVYPLVMRRRFGHDANVFDCYMATKHGWLPRRMAWFWGIGTLPILFVGFIGITSLGKCIDERGMLVTHDVNGLIPHFHTYPQVTSIELYSQLMAPIGLRHVPSLVVRFDTGDQFIYMPDNDLSAPQPAAVAQYISDRSGKPVTVGVLRP